MNELSEKQKKSIRQRERELSDIRTVISTVEGRRFFWRVLEEGKIFGEAYVHGDNGYGTTYNSGRNSISRWALFELMAAKPEAFVQMQKENSSEVKREENEIKNEADNMNILKTSA